MEITHLDTPAELSSSYTFIRQLGEGSNGKTWLAKDLKAEREVAIKVLKNIEQFKQLDLFKREAETLASIKIDGVPKLYEKFKNIIRIDKFTGLYSAEYLYSKAKRTFDKYPTSAVCMFKITNIVDITQYTQE